MSDEATDTAPASTDTAPAGDATTTQTTDTQTTATPADTGGDDATANKDVVRAPIDDGSSSSDFELPEEWKDKPWADKVKSQDDAYKQIENLTALVGKKTIAPIDYETATADEIAAHHSSLAPENVSDYVWAENSMPEITDPMGSLMQEAGINKHQQQVLSTGFDKVIEGLASDKVKADTSEEGYMKIMEESFGEDYKTTVGIIEKSLKEHAASDEDKQALDAMDNSTRAVVDRTVHSITKAYEDRIKAILDEHGVTETGAQVEGDKGVNTGVDVGEVRTDLRNKLAQIDQRPHTAEEKQTLKDKLAATYK